MEEPSDEFIIQCETELQSAIHATFDQLRPGMMRKYNQNHEMMDHLLGYASIAVGIELVLTHFPNITDDDLAAMMKHVRAMVHGVGMLSEG